MILLGLAACITLLLFAVNLRDDDHASIRQPQAAPAQAVVPIANGESKGKVDLTGHAIAPKLGNETIK